MALSVGSSPLTRGKPPSVLSRRWDPGLIPAHAGKTCWTSGMTRKHWAHPRSRGENQAAVTDGRSEHGSSPLTRGKLSARETDWPRARLIPAHAGKTFSSSGICSMRWAHPRSRGENRCVPSRPSRTVGSSPLTRGKPHRGVPDRAGTGLIPAHAGKTGLRPIPVRAEWAHPRSRGENGIVMLIEPAGGGSSPLTRGKRYAVSSRNDQSGLIPAHAGKTSCLLYTSPSPRD